MKETIRQKIETEVRQVVAAVLKKNPGAIKPENLLFGELGADSLTGVEILAQLDKKFGLDLPENKLTKIGTFSQLVDLVETEIEKSN